jgi:hypothetical protein
MTRQQTLLTILLGVCLAIVIGMIGVRLFGQSVPLLAAGCNPAPGDWLELTGALVKDYRDPCDDFYWLPNPEDEFHNRIQLNNFGLTDSPLTMEKPGGVFRVLIVGDSYPQGWQVTREQGFPWLIEQQVSQESGRQVEVINLSIDAFGTDRELLLYSILGWRFQPDLVLLVIYTGNDVQDNEIDLEARRYGYRLDRPFFTLDDGVLQLHNSIVYDPLHDQDSYAYLWLVAMQQEQGALPPVNPPDAPRVIGDSPYSLEYPVELGLYVPEDEHWANAWALTEALIVEFRDVVQEQGSQFAAVIIPDRRAVHAEDWDATVADYPFLAGIDPTGPQRRMEALLASHDIPALDLTWNLRAWVSRNVGGRLYFPSDGHYNANGHSVTAERVSGWLRASGLVP